MGKIKEGTNKYRTITTVLTATFMGKHNYAYMNTLMNTPFQKQNNLTNLKGPLSSYTDVIFSLISVLENGEIHTIQNSLLLFMQKYCQKTFFLILFDDTHHLSSCITNNGWILVCCFVLWEIYSQPSTHSEQEKAARGVRGTSGKTAFEHRNVFQTTSFPSQYGVPDALQYNKNRKPRGNFPTSL